MSLVALKECVMVMSRKGAHHSFRRSKLTHVLQDSFTGKKSRISVVSVLIWTTKHSIPFLFINM